MPRKNLELRPRHSRLAALSAFGAMAGSLALALLPAAAFANTGSVSVTEDCQTWSAQVVLDNNVIKTHAVDVVVTAGFNQQGFTGHAYDTTTGPLTIWHDSGSAPFSGTVTLVIHNPDSSVEATYSKAIGPPAKCHAPSITTSLSAGSITVPGTAHDSATLHGATADAGGTVAYTVYTDATCSQGARSAGTKTVTSGGVPDSSSLVFDSVGTVYWQAIYTGDVNNSGARSACREETLVVTKAADAVATQATPVTGVVGTSGIFGDTATISSAFHPSGSVSFSLYSDANCTTAVNGVGGSGTISTGAASFSATWTPSAAGTYYWKAGYAGDANNTGFNACGGANEVVTVTGAPAGGTQGTNVGSVLGASVTVPALPKAGHPSVELPPAGATSDLLRTISWGLVLASFLVLAAGMVSSRAGKTQE